MARQTSFSLRVDVTQVEGLADRLGRLSASAFGLAAVEAVNAVTTRFEDDSRRGATADLSLEPSYVKSKTDLYLATSPLRPRAEVVTRGDLTILGRYPVTQLYEAAGPAWENPKRGTYRGGPSKGDAKRGIPAGSKQAGLRVAVRRSAPTTQPKWFTMTLRRGTEAGGNVGVFSRSRTGKPQHIYGPSPYSLFRFQVLSKTPAIEADLQRTAADEMAAVLERVGR